jgi:hypothetical protein
LGDDGCHRLIAHFGKFADQLDAPGIKFFKLIREINQLTLFRIRK